MNLTYYFYFTTTSTSKICTEDSNDTEAAKAGGFDGSLGCRMRGVIL